MGTPWYWLRTNGSRLGAAENVWRRGVRATTRTCAGGDERLIRLDSIGDVGEYTSLAIGLDGNAVISYADTGNMDLKVARAVLRDP
jgi:hypothetical protein